MCSQCSVERGEEGVVSCLECLESEFRGSEGEIEHLEGSGQSGEGEGEGEMRRTIDWVMRQEELWGL